MAKKKKQAKRRSSPIIIILMLLTTVAFYNIMVIANIITITVSVKIIEATG